MDAVMYLKEKVRMCKSHNIDCGECPMDIDNNGVDGLYCGDFTDAYPEKSVEIVEKWSKEHPRKTYLLDFLEHFPKINYTIDELALLLCVKNMGYIDECPNIKNCKICWNTPMEDDE